MTVPFERFEHHLLIGGEKLIYRHAGDANGFRASSAMHYGPGGEVVRVFAPIMDFGHELTQLRSREIVIEPGMFGNGFEATLPDGRPVRPDMVSFDADKPGVFVYLGHVQFSSRAIAVDLLAREEIVRNYSAGESLNQDQRPASSPIARNRP